MYPCLRYPLLALPLALALPLDIPGLVGNADQTRTLLDEPTLAISRLRATSHIIPTPTSTIGPSSMSSSASTTKSAESTATSANLYIPTPTSYLPEVPPQSLEETMQWKVIGIGIITVGFIATAILSIVFFDSWWNFLCDLCGCGNRRKRGEEDMIPDWEKRDWEFKLATEDGHRYPTLSSLGEMAKEKSKPNTILSPRPAFLQDFDPHPLEPLTRRPSMR